MADVTAFERQVAARLELIAGPEPHVDAMASTRTAKTIASTGRPFSMFSVLRFVAAAVIVLLFGGFLLASIFTTQQGDEVVPAAVTASPEPRATTTTTEPSEPVVRTDLLPGVALAIEEVEPGVHRVISDGVRDVTSETVRVHVGEDGSVWSLSPDSRGFFRLGDEQTHAWPLEEYWSTFEVAPDGMVWAVGGQDRLGPRMWGIRSFDGDAWTVHKEASAAHWPGGRPLAVAPDGTVWAAWWDGDEKRSLVVARLGPEGWEPLAPPLAREGDHVALFPTDDGLRVVHTDEDAREARTYRYDDDAWQRIGPVASEATVGRDGTIWQYRLARDEAGKRLYESGGSLARFDGMEWEEFDWDGSDHGPDRLTVAADGSLWTIGGHARVCDTQPCGRVARFDGVSWDHFLPAVIATDMQPDATGAVWVTSTFGPPGLPLRLYVITPEAVAATE